MAFVTVKDIFDCTKIALRLYEYGWSNVKNATAQYHEFGQDVYRLHENLGQLEKVFQGVEASTRSLIPSNSDFFKTSSLDSILDEPYKTVNDCFRLLHRRNAFTVDRGAIHNIYWNVTIAAEVTKLHDRIKFHNVKILVLLKPLEMKLLLDIKSVVRDYGEATLARLAALEARIFGEAEDGASETCTRCDQVQIPDFLVAKFESAAKESIPDPQGGGDTFPMREGINAFLNHHKEDIGNTPGPGGFILQAPTQSPAQYLRMMKTIWIIRKVQACAEYEEACRSGNRLLKCFVDALAQKCLYDFNQFADRDLNPFRVRNEPNDADLSKLEKDAFSIWPKIPRPLDRFDEASVDSLKIILLAPMHNHSSPSRRMELLLIRHDHTLLEMIIKETSEADQATDSRSRDIDLTMVSLNPIYADPSNQSDTIDVNLYTVGNRGRDDLLSFRGYNDLYRFQSSITGYRTIIDLLDINLIIQQDKGKKWHGRIQLWNWQGESGNRNHTPYSPGSTRTSLASPLSPSFSNGSVSGPSSQYSSVPSGRSTTTQVTTIASLVDSTSDGRTEIDAKVFDLPREPLLVLFLRPQNPMRPEKDYMSLMKIPMADISARLEKEGCSCSDAAKHSCRHTMVTGVKKLIGCKPLVVQRNEQRSEPVNLAVLGAFHSHAKKQREEKLNFISFTFNSPVDRETFDTNFIKLQRLYKTNMDYYERDKVAIRFQKIQKTRR